MKSAGLVPVAPLKNWSLYVSDPFISVEQYVDTNTKTINQEISRLEELSESGVDISNMITEMSEKVAALRQNANDMIDLIYNKEAIKINDNN